jgi:hypothetical protein
MLMRASTSLAAASLTLAALALAGCQGSASPNGSQASGNSTTPPASTQPAAPPAPPAPPAPVVTATTALPGAAGALLSQPPLPRSTAGAATYTVDPSSPVTNKNFATLSALLAATTLAPGDIVEVSPAATYADMIVLTAQHSGSPGNPVVIRAKPGPGNPMAVWDGNKMSGADQDTLNNRGFFWQFDPTSHDIEVSGIEVANTPHAPAVSASGTAFSTNNRAVYFLGTNLSFHHGYVHHSGDGFMAVLPASNIRVESCEVAFNGSGDGYTHNFYMQCAGDHIRFNYIHDANAGINYKDRSVPDAAGVAVDFCYNWVQDATAGGYELDFSVNTAQNNGTTVADAFVVGNVIVKSAQGNTGFVIGASDSRVGTIYLVNNTIFAASNTQSLVLNGPVSAVAMDNNIYYGSGPIQASGATGALSGSNNLLSSAVQPGALLATTLFSGATPAPGAAVPASASGVGMIPAGATTATPSVPLSALVPVFELAFTPPATSTGTLASTGIGVVSARVDSGSVAGANTR